MSIGGDVSRSCAIEARAPAALDNEARRLRLITLSSYGGAAVTGGFAVAGALGGGPAIVAVVNIVGALALVLIPWLPVRTRLKQIIFVVVATASLCALTVLLGTSAGLLFYFFVMAAGAPMIVGSENLRLPLVTMAIAVTSVCVLHFTVPDDTGLAPDWLMTAGFVVNTVAASGLGVAIMSMGVRQTRRAELALEDQYDRSEALLDNILPRDVADRLKDPSPVEIADTFDDASILFADLAGFTAMSSRHTPAEVVGYLNELYLALDTLTDRYGLEKIKTTGDSYMVVSGVPAPRPDHLQVLARFALDMRAVCQRVVGPDGEPMHLRVGLACGPVVAGVIGSKKFFYDVWGDAVNLAARMESTGEPDRIQVPQAVKERLSDEFDFTERGSVVVKGKGIQQTWFLTGTKITASPDQLDG